MYDDYDDFVLQCPAKTHQHPAKAPIKILQTSALELKRAKQFSGLACPGNLPFAGTSFWGWKAAAKVDT